MRGAALAVSAILCALSGTRAAPAPEPAGLAAHIRSIADLGELRAMTAEWHAGTLQLVTPSAARYAWTTLPAPPGGWPLTLRAAVEAEIVNRGTVPASVLLWVVGRAGWDAVADTATLAPGASRRFVCPLRATFPDGTPRLDPGRVKQVQVMLTRAAPGAALEVRTLAASGEAPAWSPPPDRLEVPEVADAPPAAGRRVRHRLADHAQPGFYAILHLPEDWKPGATHPLIVEFPGNIFFTPECYSTGRPEQCVIGYGITKGRGTICLSLPFVDPEAGSIAEHGWGDADATADYAVRMVENVCANYGGDRRNVLLTGFSRGAIACGYIGLRHDRIARLWKGFHACQHYDGDGWNGATMEGALERARRFAGRAIFHTDNSERFFEPVMSATKARVTYVQSGLGAHACAMFLDDRPSTQRLRRWWADLVAEPAP
jgi:hypothetical protein